MKKEQLRLFLLQDTDENTCVAGWHYTRNKAILAYSHYLTGEDYWRFKKGGIYKSKVLKKYDGLCTQDKPCLADDRRCVKEGIYGRIEDICDKCGGCDRLHCEDGEYLLCSKCL